MDDENIKYNPLPEDPVPIGPKKEKPRKVRKERAKSEELISMSCQENFVDIALETIEKAKQEAELKPGSAIDIFTHSKTGFPGAWPEEDVMGLLNAWEQAMDTLRASDEPINVCDVVIEILKKNGFRDVTKFQVWNLMQKLRTEYKTYRNLQALGIQTMKAECLPQMMRIFRKRSNRRYRRRNPSTASNMTVSEDSANGMQLKHDAVDQGAPNRNRRMNFQRQNMQRTMRVLISQQKSVLDYLQSVSKTYEDSNNKVVALLEQLVALQKN